MRTFIQHCDSLYLISNSTRQGCCRDSWCQSNRVVGTTSVACVAYASMKVYTRYLYCGGRCGPRPTSLTHLWVKATLSFSGQEEFSKEDSRSCGAARAGTSQVGQHTIGTISGRSILSIAAANGYGLQAPSSPQQSRRQHANARCWQHKGENYDRGLLRVWRVRLL